MPRLAYPLALAGPLLAFVPATGSAAPTMTSQPAVDGSAVHRVQEFGIYIGPRYRYRDPYWDYDYDYGYYPGYSYYGPRYYYYGRYYDGPRRPFRRLDRRAP
jgi:hypothetical protein